MGAQEWGALVLHVGRAKQTIVVGTVNNRAIAVKFGQISGKRHIIYKNMSTFVVCLETNITKYNQ